MSAPQWRAPHFSTPSSSYSLVPAGSSSPPAAPSSASSLPRSSSSSSARVRGRQSAERRARASGPRAAPRNTAPRPPRRRWRAEQLRLHTGTAAPCCCRAHPGLRRSRTCGGRLRATRCAWPHAATVCRAAAPAGTRAVRRSESLDECGVAPRRGGEYGLAASREAVLQHVSMAPESGARGLDGG
jgi:hypothetical protein